MNHYHRLDRFLTLLTKLEECEHERRAVNFPAAAHSINAAKNSVGWEFAAVMERAALTTPTDGGAS